MNVQGFIDMTISIPVGIVLGSLCLYFLLFFYFLSLSLALSVCLSLSCSWGILAAGFGFRGVFFFF
jgi:hypothetical protein